MDKQWVAIRATIRTWRTHHVQRFSLPGDTIMSVQQMIDNFLCAYATPNTGVDPFVGIVPNGDVILSGPNDAGWCIKIRDTVFVSVSMTPEEYRYELQKQFDGEIIWLDGDISPIIFDIIAMEQQ